MNPDLVSFAARRRRAQDQLIAALEPVVGAALDAKQAGNENWWRRVVESAHPLFDRIVTEDGGSPARSAAAWARLSLDLTHSLVRTGNIDEYTHTVIAVWVANAVISAATVDAANQDGETYELEWVSMHDSKVRHTHADADGQRVKPGHHFRVGRSSMRWPGDSTAPVKEWINCRCTVAPVPIRDIAASKMDTGLRPGGETMNDTLVAATDGTGLIPWHGVIVPEGVWSGDKRRFAKGALTWRDFPLPLTYQKSVDEGHDGAVTVASIDWTEKRGDTWHGGGYFLPTTDADEAVGLLAHFGKYGVSVDADSVEMAMDDSEEGLTFSEARGCSASMVSIPAFAEAYITLGEDPDHQTAQQTEDQPHCDCSDPACDDPSCHQVPAMPQYSGATATFTWPVSISAAISEKPWDGSASRFTPEQYKRSCILHKCDGLEKSCHSLPIREPNGDLSRRGVHAAASRLNQVDATASQKAAAARALRSAYRQLGEDPPDGLAGEVDVFTIETLVDVPEDSVCLHDGCQAPPTKAVSTDDPIWFGLFCDKHAAEHEDQPLAWSGSTTEFGRGPGWLTNPADTKRIHDYWTVPGQPGYEKINWGVAGDFNRCRVEVGEEIGEDSPEKLRFINQICSQWHHDATGFWPGHAPSEGGSLEQPDGEMAPALTIVASNTVVAPHEWFTDPKLDRLTPVTITEEGRIFGHVADWNTCHMSFAQPGTCIMPPRSSNNYAFYRMGEVITDQGPVATGVVTLATKHAPGRLGMAAAVSHYDNTGSAVADVVAGDDQFGPWISGWVRPWISEEKVYELRAHPPSGDWRRNPNTGEFDMIGVLSVNAPGYPVRRVGFSDGQQMSLVASLGPVEPVDPDSPVAELAEAVAAAIEGRAKRREAMADLAVIFDEDAREMFSGLELEGAD